MLAPQICDCGCGYGHWAADQDLPPVHYAVLFRVAFGRTDWPLAVDEARFNELVSKYPGDPRKIRRQVARSLKWLADRRLMTPPPAAILRLAVAYNSVSPIVRARIFERDKTCRECGSADSLTIDHILSRFKGGENEEANLQVLCLTCNTRKGITERWEACRGEAQ